MSPSLPRGAILLRFTHNRAASSSALTAFESKPRPATSTSTRSPGFNQIGESSLAPARPTRERHDRSRIILCLRGRRRMDERPGTDFRALLDRNFDQAWAIERQSLLKRPSQRIRRSGAERREPEALRHFDKVRIDQLGTDQPPAVSLLLIATDIAVGIIVEDNAHDIDAMLYRGRHFLRAEQKSAIAGDR